MNTFIYKAAVLLICVSFFSCDKQNDNLEKPVLGDQFPQVVVLADEGDGGLEDEDKFSFKITLADRRDPSGQEPGGKIIPLEEDVTIQFRITGFEGFNQLSDYIVDGSAFYEIDDCTTSADQGEDLNFRYNTTTGEGSVTFPAGVEEIEIEFETDPVLFDDNIFNTVERSVTIQLAGIISNDTGIVVNKTAEFVYTVQDDEGIYGSWELDLSDVAAFNKFRELFGLVNEDIQNLDIADVASITIEFEYGEVKAIVELIETEQIDDCGTISVENKIIEVEAEIEELDDDATSGNVEFGEVLELGNGVFREFVYEGTFSITGSQLLIKLTGEFGDDQTSEISLLLDK